MPRMHVSSPRLSGPGRPSPPRPRRLAALRLVAWMLDCVVIGLWIGVTAIIGFAVTTAFPDGLPSSGPWWLLIVSTVFIVLPVTVVAALLESGPKQATLGKRWLGLRVAARADDRRLGFGRALARNAIKIAVPWTLGHLCAVILLSPTSDLATAFAVAIGYVVPIVWIVTLVMPSGLTPYDRISGSHVTPAPR